MRYTAEQKEEARHKLLHASGRHAKAHGFAASGVDALAGAAGLTIGSLYKHFASKNDLFTALMAAEIDQTASRYASVDPHDTAAAVKALASYLSLAHVQAPERGCALPSLAVEVARAPEEVRQVFETSLLALKDSLQRLAGSEQAAWTLMAQSVGAVMLARAMATETHQRDLLQAVRVSGQDLIHASRAQ